MSVPVPSATDLARPTVTIEVRSTSGEENDLEELSRSLREPLPRIPSRLFYDDVGSALFERICELPEYYPTRTERALLTEVAPEIARATRAATLVEIGSGAATKTRLLLDALRDQGTLRLYVPFDVAEATTRRIGDELTAEYPGLGVHGILGNFLTDLAPLPRADEDGTAPGRKAPGTRLAIFLGSTIGNLDPDEAARFVADLHAALDPGDAFLLGVDRVKPIARLEAAYDDAAGVTAAFNLNILEATNRIADGDFDPAGFRHRAFFDPVRSRIEMRLVSSRRQKVTLRALDLELEFAPGAEILTEISTKYDRERAERLLAGAGFQPEGWYTDAEDLFALILARRI